MKRRCWIIAGAVLAIALACGITLWRDAQVIKWQTDHMPELKTVLTLAENRGTDWATDELLINNVDSFGKKSLYSKWGEATERSASEKEDIWILSDQFRLIVDYDDAERIERIVVLPNE